MYRSPSHSLGLYCKAGMRYSLGIAPFGAFSLSPFALDTSRSIRTLLGVSEFFFDAIAAERPILPVPPLAFNPLCLALARQGTLELFPLCVPYLKILRSLVTPCTFSAFRECNPNLTPLHVLGCLGCCVGFLSISMSFHFESARGLPLYVTPPNTRDLLSMKSVSLLI